MDRNQLKPCGFFFLIYRFLTCWFWVVVHMLYHSNVPGFIIFFEASFSTTKNHSILWDQNHFTVELSFVRCWINAMSSMDISVLISSKFIPSIQTIHPLKRMSKFFSVKSGNIFTVSALWQLKGHSDLSSFRTNVKVFMPREDWKNQCFYFYLLLTTLWLFVYSANRLLPFFHMTFEKIILINTEPGPNNTLNLSLFSLGKGLILSYGFRELSYGTSIFDAKSCIFGVFKSKTFI